MAISEINDKSLAASAVNLATTTVTGILPAANTVANLSPGNNLIINGAMQVAQRATSSTAEGYSTVDRFRMDTGGGTITRTQEGLTSGSPYDEGFRNHLRLTVTSAGSNAATDFCYISQNIEAQNIANSGWDYTSSSSYVTLQFWVRTSLAGTYYTIIRSVDGTARAFVMPVVLSANTWTKFTQAISGDSATFEVDNNNGTGLIFEIRPYVGTNYTDSGVSPNTWYSRSGSAQTPDYAQNWQSTGSATFDLTGVQLEVGTVATPFEHRSYGQELALCQRYHTRIEKASGQAISTTAGVLCGVFPTEMRASPTGSLSGALTIWQLGIAGSKTQSSSNIVISSSINSVSVFNAECTNFSSLTAHQAIAVGGSTQPLIFDAEL